MGFIAASKHDTAEYKNINPMLGMIISKRLATLKELNTFYGISDVLDMMEIITVDAYNDYQSRQRNV